MGNQRELEWGLATRGWSGKVKVHYDPASDGEYTAEARNARRQHNGQIGVIQDISNSHGLCFGVQFRDRTMVYYEVDELETEPAGGDVNV